MKKMMPIAVILLALPLLAEWSGHGLTLLSTGPSGLEGAVKYDLKDGEGRAFSVNSAREPDGVVMEKIIRQKNGFFAWKHVAVKDLSFFVYEKGVYAVIVPSTVTYKDTDLKPYLPSGFSFVEEKNKLNYKFRIVVEDTSLKLDCAYFGEEPMLEEIYAHVRGIKEGKIIVKDEKVVAGSIFSLTDEKNKEQKNIDPMKERPVNDKDTESKQAHKKLGLYVSAQGSYLLPVSLFSDIFISGYGFTVSCGLRDMGISYRNKTLFTIEFDLSSGFWNLNERKQKDDAVSWTVTNAYIVPITLTSRYRIGIIRDFSLAPSVSFGYNYNKLNYEILSSAGNYESVSVREWNPSLMFGLRLDYRFEKIFIFTGAEFLAIFERRMTITSLLFNAGCGYLF